MRLPLECHIGVNRLFAELLLCQRHRDAVPLQVQFGRGLTLRIDRIAHEHDHVWQRLLALSQPLRLSRVELAGGCRFEVVETSDRKFLGLENKPTHLLQSSWNAIVSNDPKLGTLLQDLLHAIQTHLRATERQRPQRSQRALRLSTLTR